MQEMLEFIQSNLSHVAPILIAGLFAIAIMLERCFALYMVYPIRNVEGFFERIRDSVMAGRLAEAVALCERYSSKPVAQVVKVALLRAHQPESLIENGLEIAIEEAASRLQRRTAFLSMIANVATLLGLFGTIAGLVASFQAIGSVDASQRATLLARGISSAMNATMLGLGVAIPCMIMFSFLMNTTTKLMGQVESAATKTLDVIKQKYFESETRRAA